MYYAFPKKYNRWGGALLIRANCKLDVALSLKLDKHEQALPWPHLLASESRRLTEAGPRS